MSTGTTCRGTGTNSKPPQIPRSDQAFSHTGSMHWMIETTDSPVGRSQKANKWKLAELSAPIPHNLSPFAP